jgi:hypothetical protein
MLKQIGTGVFWGNKMLNSKTTVLACKANESCRVFSHFGCLKNATFFNTQLIFKQMRSFVYNLLFSCLPTNYYLLKAKKLIEDKLGWGDSTDWSNQDFSCIE